MRGNSRPIKSLCNLGLAFHLADSLSDPSWHRLPSHIPRPFHVTWHLLRLICDVAWNHGPGSVVRWRGGMGRVAKFYEVIGFNADSSGQWVLLDFMDFGMRLWVIWGETT